MNYNQNMYQSLIVSSEDESYNFTNTPLTLQLKKQKLSRYHSQQQKVMKLNERTHSQISYENKIQHQLLALHKARKQSIVQEDLKKVQMNYCDKYCNKKLNKDKLQQILKKQKNFAKQYNKIMNNQCKNEQNQQKQKLKNNIFKTLRQNVQSICYKCKDLSNNAKTLDKNDNDIYKAKDLSKQSNRIFKTQMKSLLGRRVNEISNATKGDYDKEIADKIKKSKYDFISFAKSTRKNDSLNSNQIPSKGQPECQSLQQNVFKLRFLIRRYRKLTENIK